MSTRQRRNGGAASSSSTQQIAGAQTAHESNAAAAEQIGEVEEEQSWLERLFSGNGRSRAAAREGDQEAELGPGQSPTGRLPGIVNEKNRRKAVKYELSDPRAQEDYKFRGVTAKALIYTITFEDGVSFPIIAPAAPDEKMHYHSVAEAAKAVSHIAKPSRERISSILLNAVENPDDAYWAAQYNRPDFHSYMTAGPSGQITIYPDDSKDVPKLDTLKNLMVHETGHTWSYQKWGTDKTKGGWVDWKAAMDKDGTYLSEYAKASIAEDVAETVQAYASSEGHRRHEHFRKRVPNRFAVLDRDFT